MERAKWPDALRVALSGVNVEAITSSTFAQAISDDQTFAGWVEKMKQKFKTEPLGGPVAPPALRPLTTADAGAAAEAAAGGGEGGSAAKTAVNPRRARPRPRSHGGGISGFEPPVSRIRAYPRVGPATQEDKQLLIRTT